MPGRRPGCGRAATGCPPPGAGYTGYTSRSGGAAGSCRLGASGVNDESRTRLPGQPALTEHDSWAAGLIQHAAELIAGSQVQALVTVRRLRVPSAGDLRLARAAVD